MNTRFAGTAAVMGLVYIAAASWLVHIQGKAYRQHLRNALSTPTARVRERLDMVRSTPGLLAPVAVQKTPESKPSVERPAPPTEPSEAPKPRVAEAPEPSPAVAQPARSPKPSPAKRPPIVIAGLSELSPADEARFGQILHELIVADHGIDKDGPFQRRIEEAVRPLLERRDSKEVAVTVTVLDSDEVNLFSHLGGYLYVTRGLFHLAATDEEFCFLVGHELAHLDGKHSQALVDQATRDGKLGGLDTLQALYHQIAAGYSDAQEFVADDRAIDQMRRLDMTKRECLAFLRKLVKRSEQLGFGNGHKAPRSAPADAVQDVENHIRTGPALWSRLNRQESRFRTETAAPGR